MLTRQEIFDKVSTHLLKQRARSAVRSQCKYRTPNGLMCAAGCLIADEHYDEKFEGSAVCGPGELPKDDHMDPLLEKAMNLSGVASEDFGLVSALQRLHDYDAPHTWKTKLKTIASTFELNVPA